MFNPQEASDHLEAKGLNLPREEVLELEKSCASTNAKENEEENRQRPKEEVENNKLTNEKIPKANYVELKIEGKTNKDKQTELTKNSSQNSIKGRSCSLTAIAGIVGCFVTIIACLLTVPSGFLGFRDIIEGWIYQSPNAAIKITGFGAASPTTTRLDETQVNPKDFSDLSAISFPGNNTVNFRIDNLSNKTMSLSNQLPIQLVNYSSISEEVYLFSDSIGGGGGYFIKYLALISPSKQGEIFWGEYRKKTGGLIATPDVGPDLYTIPMQEPLFLSLSTLFSKPGIYEIKVGVSLLENENTHIWSDKTLKILVPSKLVFRSNTIIRSCTFKSQVDINLADSIYGSYDCIDKNVNSSTPTPNSLAPQVTSESTVTPTPVIPTLSQSVNCEECRSKIVFNKAQSWFTNDFSIITADGSDQKKLTFIDSLKGDPIWSPDGNKIAFTFYNTTEGIYEMAVTNDPINGTDYKIIGSNAIFRGWSPDSKWLTFNRNWDVYIIDNNGNNEKLLYDANQSDDSPLVINWSPNSNSIAFSTNNGLAKTNINGSGFKLLASSDSELGIQSPVWSPNGEYISFSKSKDNCSEPPELMTFCYEIYRIRPDGTDLKQLTNNDLNETALIWSKDSQKMVFIGMAKNSITGIFSMNSDGSNVNKILEDPSGINSISRSPDGDCILFAVALPSDPSINPFPRSDLFVMNIDGTDRTRLTSDGVISAQWIPSEK